MSLTEQQIRDRIAEIDSILQAGATSANVDGVTVSWDFGELRDERASLQRQLPDQATKKRRPLIYRSRLA